MVTPYLPQAAYGYADALYNLKRFKEAADAYERVINGFPDSPIVGDAISGLQWCAVQLGDMDRALKVADKFAENNPESPLVDDLAMRIGDLLYNNGDYIHAASAYNRLIQRYPGSELVPAALLWKGRAHLGAADSLNALSTWAEMAKRFAKNPLTPQALFFSGQVQMGLRDTTAALPFFVRIRMDHPSAEIAREARLLEGTILRISGKPNQSIELLKPLVGEKTLDPISARAEVETARALSDLGRGEDALKRVARISVERSDEVGAEAQFETGRILSKLGRTQEAIDGYLKVRYLFEAYTDWIANAQIEAARLYVGQKKIPDAKRLLDRVKSTHGSDKWGLKADEIIKTLP